MAYNSYSVDLLIDLAEYFNVSLDFLILGKERANHQLKTRLRLLIQELIILEECL